MQDFKQSGDSQRVLPTAVFLIGYVLGPLVFSPLSETIGRKPVLVWSFSVFVLATLGCAFSPNWAALLVFRSICGLMGAAPQTVIGGVYADMFVDLRSRGRAMAGYMSVCFAEHIDSISSFRALTKRVGCELWPYSRAHYLWVLCQIWLAVDISH
jgi:MFS family permease